MSREVSETQLTTTVTSSEAPPPTKCRKQPNQFSKGSWNLAVGWLYRLYCLCWLSILTIIHFLNGYNERTVKWKHNSHI